jgi:hypothetical protein
VLKEKKDLLVGLLDENLSFKIHSKTTPEKKQEQKEVEKPKESSEKN